MNPAGVSLYEDFSGHEAEIVGTIEIPAMPDSLVMVGECDGILYTAVRDGKRESYIHRFKKSSRPLLCSSPDGNSLYLIGGSYRFTDAGITDY